MHSYQLNHQGSPFIYFHLKKNHKASDFTNPGSFLTLSQFSCSLRSHGLYSPWNSPGQNTGVGSLSLLQPGIKPRSPALQADSSLAEPQGKHKNTGVGSLSLLQGIFPTQGSNQGLLHFRWILYQLSHKGSPRILEWVAYPFSRGLSQPRN